ncbi:hypothetical protein ACWGCP_29755 [Streptomyces niveus]
MKGIGRPFTAPLAARSDRSSQTLVSRLSPDAPDAFRYANGSAADAGDLHFEIAARLRDEVSEMKKELRQMREAGMA